jgi:CO dehydrogenase maturation factor
VPREAILEERTDAAGHTEVSLTRPLEEILAEYGAMGPDRVGVLTMTGLLGAGKGCICGQHSAVRDVMEQLASTGPREITILDTEASIEHLSRGTVRNVDALLVVTEPYYRSLETAGRVVPLAQELGVPAVWVVANKIRDERDKEAILQYGAGHGFEIIAAIPFDAQVAEADSLGRSVIDHAPGASAVAAIGALADVVADRLGATLQTA